MTSFDASYKPKLRPLEAFPAGDPREHAIGVRDPGGLSQVVLTVSPAAFELLSMMDGETSCEALRERFSDRFGQALRIDTVLQVVQNLEGAHLLDSDGFEAFYASLVRKYRDQPTRPMPHASALGILDDSGDLFRDMLAQAEPTIVDRRLVGLVAPHLDYPRGRPCYGCAYATLKERKSPDRVVILGTNHFGRATSAVATSKPFETPLGVTPCDVDFLEALESTCGSLREHELDHAHEHSIELQVAWLQHLFGAGEFSIVPVLCPDPCGPTGTAPYDGHGVDLRAFALALGKLIQEDQKDTLLVAGADLSHVGRDFGDDRELDDTFLAEVRQRDKSALQAMESGDWDAFRQCVARDGNPTRVCSAGCIYALATALGDADANLLAYHQAVTPEIGNCVTCCAMAFLDGAAS